MKDDKTILVWQWDDAPEAYQELSEHGGDEDWVVFVPQAVLNDWAGDWLLPSWIGNGKYGPLGWLEEHDIDGGKLFIGAHA